MSVDPGNLPAPLAALDLGTHKRRSSAGDWFVCAGKTQLPTEKLRSSVPSTSDGCVTLVQERSIQHRVVCDAAEVQHPHLICANKIEVLSDDMGHRLVLQRLQLRHIPPAAQLVPDRPAECVTLILAVARALTHLHTLGIAHGAIALDNIFLGPRGWLLGPTACSDSPFEKDLKDLAKLIDCGVAPGAIRSPETKLLAELRCLSEMRDAKAATVAIAAEAGHATPLTNLIKMPPAPRRVDSNGTFALHGACPSVLLVCSLHLLPQAGALVPQSQLCRFGNVIHPTAAGVVRVPRGQEPVAVVTAALHSGLAIVGDPLIIDAASDWGSASAHVEAQMLRLQWFWPPDPACTAMRLQVRPDRFPRPGSDQSALEDTCHRWSYDVKHHAVIQLPVQWRRAFVRISQPTPHDKCDRHACFASAGAQA